MESPTVSAVLFAKDLRKVADFYSRALGMQCTHADEHHSVLKCHGFEFIVHQIPQHLLTEIPGEKSVERRIFGNIRLSFPVKSVDESRRLAKGWGGVVDDAPPDWADPGDNVFLGHDPEGNVFKISEYA